MEMEEDSGKNVFLAAPDSSAVKSWWNPWSWLTGWRYAQSGLIQGLSIELLCRASKTASSFFPPEEFPVREPFPKLVIAGGTETIPTCLKIKRESAGATSIGVLLLLYSFGLKENC